jgi:hypothetical protein
MSEPKPRLRKVEWRFQHQLEGTWEVLLGGAVIGHVQKFRQSERTRTEGVFKLVTTWGVVIPGEPEDASGYDTRKDAVAEVVRKHEKKGQE